MNIPLEFYGLLRILDDKLKDNRLFVQFLVIDDIYVRLIIEESKYYLHGKTPFRQISLLEGIVDEISIEYSLGDEWLASGISGLLSFIDRKNYVSMNNLLIYRPTKEYVFLMKYFSMSVLSDIDVAEMIYIIKSLGLDSKEKFIDIKYKFLPHGFARAEVDELVDTLIEKCCPISISLPLVQS